MLDYGVRKEILLALVLRKKPGRPRSNIKIILNPKKRGRPRTWTEEDYRYILAALERGKKLLAKRGAIRITDLWAMEEVAVREIPRTKMTERDARAFGRQCAKRLPDARKAIQKLVVK